MFRYFQKALRELEESADELQAEGGLKELHEGQGVSGQDLVNHKKRDKELRREGKKRKKEAMKDVKTIENDHVDVNEVRKKKKKKRKHDLENDNEEMNSHERESSKAQSKVDGSSVVSSSKEIRENDHVDVSEVRKKKKKKKKREHDNLENDTEEENSYERESSKARSKVDDSSVVSSSKEIRENDHVDVSEVRKKKEKKRKHDLENDNEEENSYERESSKVQFDQSRVNDSSVVSSSKEIKKKRKRESQMEVLDGAVKKSKHSENKSKSHKHRDKEKSDKRHEINISSNQRTENVQMFSESNTLEQSTSSLEDSPGSSPHPNIYHCKKPSLHVSGNGHVHVCTEKDQRQEKRTKRTGNTMTDAAADRSNLVNGNNNKSESVNSRVDPSDVSNIIIDEAKLREATVISNTIHETWTLSNERVKQLAEKGIKVKKGRWSIQERDLLQFNMARFLERHNMTDNSPLLFHSGMDKDERKHWKRFVKSHDFYKELGKGIHRELATIYKCALRIYDANNYVGRYTEDEIKDLKRLHGIYGSNWVTIGQMMGRSRHSVNRKNSKLPPTFTVDKEDPKGKWTDDELKLLKEAVHLVTKTVDGEPVFHGIDWQGVAKIVKTRGSEQCRKKWLSKLCWSKTENNTERKWTKSDDIKLITRFYNSGVMEEWDVDWMEVKSEYDIDYSPQWIREKWTKLKKNVPNYQRLSFEDVVEYLYRAYGSTTGDKVQPEPSSDNADNTV